MTRTDCEKFGLLIYEEFMKEISHKNFKLRLNTNDKVMYGKFIQYLSSVYNLNSIGVDFLIKWIESNFNYWYHQKIKHGYKRIQFNWIFGKKAIERYERIKDKDKYLQKYKFKSIRKIIDQEIYVKFNLEYKSNFLADVKKQVLNLNEIEEVERQRYLNKEKIGLNWCLINTTLYNHLSKNCFVCLTKQHCKSLLKKNFNEIYKIRGYEG